MARKRRQEQSSAQKEPTRTPRRQTEDQRLQQTEKAEPSENPDMAQSKWLVLAVASGAFAATNGLFAKLTTTTLTASISQGISHFLSLPSGADTVVEYITRGVFFIFNIVSNIIMWALFTRALTASPSTTKVTITNTAANFLVTAMFGMIVFREKVAGRWWLGAAGMGAGCILVGMRDEKGKGENEDGGGSREDGEVEEREILLEGLDESR